MKNVMVQVMERGDSIHDLRDIHLDVISTTL
jgi:hypothetical protein